MTRYLLTTALAALFATAAVAQTDSEESDADSTETEQAEDQSSDTSGGEDTGTESEESEEGGEGDAADDETASDSDAGSEATAESSDGQDDGSDSAEEASSDSDDTGSDEEADTSVEDPSASDDDSADDASDETEATEGEEAAAGSDDTSTPEIVTEGFTIEGATVTLPRIVAEEDGYVVIHTVLDGQPVAPASVGNAPVPAGVNEDVEVTIDYDFVPGEDYVAMLHAETNDNDTYDFGEGSTDVDTPVTVDGEVVVSGFVAP